MRYECSIFGGSAGLQAREVLALATGFSPGIKGLQSLLLVFQRDHAQFAAALGGKALGLS